MANNRIIPDDILWVHFETPIAQDNGRYWIVVKSLDGEIEVASLATGKRGSITKDDVLWVYRPVLQIEFRNDFPE